MVPEQQFSLRWSEYKATLISVFEKLLENGTLVDCTFSAEGKSLEAHRAVMSACSPYLELLLNEHSEKHPVVILKDVKYEQLKAMIDYMYRGEIIVSKDQIESLLTAAESLKIRGLTSSNDNDSSKKENSEKNSVTDGSQLSSTTAECVQVQPFPHISISPPDSQQQIVTSDSLSSVPNNKAEYKVQSESESLLQWNEHGSTLVAVFERLLGNGSLVDCTLAAEGQFIKAHKAVLSACSPYFELMLNQYCDKHPIIVLQNVKFNHLKAMVEYMYRGEVSISLDQIKDFCEAAKSLQIKGLIENDQGSQKTTESPNGIIGHHESPQANNDLHIPVSDSTENVSEPEHTSKNAIDQNSTTVKSESPEEKRNEQQFSLRWGDHGKTLVTVFQRFLKSSALVDCTLSAEGQHLKAHKTVLSACSLYFEMLLTQYNEKHPVVILKDVKFEQLKTMIEYMYHGEVIISKDRIKGLCRTAEYLQVKGFATEKGTDVNGKIDIEIDSDEDIPLESRLPVKKRSTIFQKRPRGRPPKAGKAIKTMKSEIAVKLAKTKRARNVKVAKAAQASKLLRGISISKDPKVRRTRAAAASAASAIKESCLYDEIHSERKNDPLSADGDEGSQKMELMSAILLQRKSEGVQKIEPEESDHDDNMDSMQADSIDEDEIADVKPPELVKVKCEVQDVKSESADGNLQIGARRVGRPLPGTRPFKCLDCGKTYRQQSSLSTHKRSHRGDVYRCDACNKPFNHRSHLIRHLRVHSERSANAFPCTVCGKVYKQPGSLASHRRQHEEVYKCDTCNKEFSKRLALIRHMNVHSTERSFMCGICGKSYRQRSSLSTHHRAHRGEGVMCDVCGKVFNDSSHLKRHSRAHTGEKPYKCSTCGKAFAQHFILTNHVRIHTGEKPFVCELCGKAFRQPGSLHNHRRDMHGGPRKPPRASHGQRRSQAAAAAGGSAPAPAPPPPPPPPVSAAPAPAASSASALPLRGGGGGGGVLPTAIIRLPPVLLGHHLTPDALVASHAHAHAHAHAQHPHATHSPHDSPHAQHMSQQQQQQHVPSHSPHAPIISHVSHIVAHEHHPAAHEMHVHHDSHASHDSHLSHGGHDPHDLSTPTPHHAARDQLTHDPHDLSTPHAMHAHPAHAHAHAAHNPHGTHAITLPLHEALR